MLSFFTKVCFGLQIATVVTVNRSMYGSGKQLLISKVHFHPLALCQCSSLFIILILFLFHIHSSARKQSSAFLWHSHEQQHADLHHRHTTQTAVWLASTCLTMARPLCSSPCGELQKDLSERWCPSDTTWGRAFFSPLVPYCYPDEFGVYLHSIITQCYDQLKEMAFKWLLLFVRETWAKSQTREVKLLKGERLSVWREQSNSTVFVEA